MNETNQGIFLMITFVEHGGGSSLSEYYQQNGVSCHFQCKGHGTASSELLDILGVGSAERDILISIGAKADVENLILKIKDDDLNDFEAGRGIVCTMPITGLNQIVTAAILSKSLGETMEGDMHMEKADHSLILIIVNQGHTDEVMNTARGAGARGGTVIRSRWAGSEESTNFYGMTFQEEKEILAIIVSQENRNAIMEMINKQHGLKTKAGAIICSLGIDKITKVS